jgi:hypothetical protein
LVPTPGVYTFAGDGQEKLSFMATHQQQGRTLPATVTHEENNCWRFEIVTRRPAAPTCSRGEPRNSSGPSIDVGGTPVHALHYHAERTISGSQTGHEVSDFWFSVANGMLVRNERDIRVISPAPAPLHSVTYTEHGWFQLEALTARS